MVIMLVEPPKKDIKEAYETARDKIEEIINKNTSEDISEKRKTLKKILDIKSKFSINFAGYSERDRYCKRLSEEIIKYRNANF